jgi:phospholipid/cholesterol/gamma-HCH transport system substrate-binding protein
MLETDPRRRLKVGLFTGVLVVLLGASVLVLGKKERLFTRHVHYATRFVHVGGLVPGAPVHLNGVVVGDVEKVALSGDPAQREIVVGFRVDARVASRVRADSKVRIRSLGLLGDRYLEVSSGSPAEPAVPPGSEVASLEPTDVSAVISQGGDVVTNVLAISTSLRRVLERVERGEGVLGELTQHPERGRKVVENLTAVLEQTNGLLHDVRRGEGAIGRLLNDPRLGSQLVDDLAGFARAGRQVTEALARDLERDDSMVAGLLRDPQGRERLQRTLDEVANAAAAAATAGRSLTEGRGTLAQLLNDEAYAREFLADLAALTQSLRSVADKLDHGAGSAGRFLNDPQLYVDLENVVRGVQQSKLMRWYVQNRREAGEQAGAAATPPPER